MRNIHTPRSSTKDPPTTASSTSSARMPYDRSNSAAAAPSSSSSSSSRYQSQAPTLAKRTPIVPKLAAKASPAPASQRQTVTLTTPAPRRAAGRSEAALCPGTSYGSSPSLAVNYASPVPKLANLVAPRSGSRQSRLSGANTSPKPAESVAESCDTRSALGGIPAPSLEPPRSTPSLNRDAKFFYASDASKGAQPPPPPLQRAPTSQPKGPTFFYANGNNLPATDATPNVAPPPLLSPRLPASPSDPMASQFMYANGTPDLKPSLITSVSGGGSVVSTTSRTSARPVSGPALGSGSVVSTTPRVPSARPVSGPPLAAAAPRVPSPPKPTSHPYLPTQSAPGPSLAERRSVFASTPHLSHTAPNLKRISADAPARKSSGHSRSGSMVAESPSGSRMMAPSSAGVSPLPSPLVFHNTGLSMASVLEAAGALEDHDDTESTLGSELTSPKSATGSGNDPLNELVANARRERKVQDLQITNASLEAINRTLERQLRKQTNELRRFKRMARAGRLSSCADTASSPRIASGSTVREAIEDPPNQPVSPDLSEEDADLDLAEGEEDLESELSDSDSTGSGRGVSPITMASRDVRHRRQDEKRLQVDLSKHRQMLVDSQKMNQSIKRCLGWTEELISEGRRALAYRVRVSEVDVGGRVAPDDVEKPYIYDGAALWEHQDEDPESDVEDEGEETDDGGDADADDTMRLRIERPRLVDETGGTKDAQDRDSGIVLTGDAV